MQNRSMGCFIVEAKYGPKLVAQQQLVEVSSDDTFRSLLLRVLQHDGLRARGAELKIQVSFGMGSNFVSVPSVDSVITMALQRFPDVKTLSYTIEPVEGDVIEVKSLASPGQWRARILRVLGVVVRIVGTYELVLFALRLGLRLTGVAGSKGTIDTDMADTMAFAEAVVQMNSEELEEVKQLYEMSNDDFAALKAAVKADQRRLGIAPSQSSKDSAPPPAPKVSRQALREAAGVEPWVPSGEPDNADLDGALGRDAVPEYDATAQKSKRS